MDLSYDIYLTLEIKIYPVRPACGDNARVKIIEKIKLRKKNSDLGSDRIGSRIEPKLDPDPADPDPKIFGSKNVGSGSGSDPGSDLRIRIRSGSVASTIMSLVQFCV